MIIYIQALVAAISLGREIVRYINNECETKQEALKEVKDLRDKVKANPKKIDSIWD